mgnify:CR=1 FL=1
MKNENIIQVKSFEFAIMIVESYKELMDEHKEFVLSKQLVRSGTSIGANVEESIGAYSQKDFLHKLSISYKEARETKYWIRLLQATNFMREDKAEILINEVEQIIKIIGKIQSSMRLKLNARYQ